MEMKIRKIWTGVEDKKPVWRAYFEGTEESVKGWGTCPYKEGDEVRVVENDKGYLVITTEPDSLIEQEARMAKAEDRDFKKTVHESIPQQVFNARQSALKDACSLFGNNPNVNQIYPRWVLEIAESFEAWILRQAG